NIPAHVQPRRHLCYGYFGGRHFVEPKDAARMVEFANASAAAIPHRLAYVHMPVPIDRDDDAFHRPFGSLALAPGTELFLGVVHAADRVAGAEARIAGGAPPGGEVADYPRSGRAAEPPPGHLR